MSGAATAEAGAPPMSANLVCAGVGAGMGALVGAVGSLLLVGFTTAGFLGGIAVVSKRFRHLL